MQEFESLTEPNPLASVERIYEGVAGFEVKPFGGATSPELHSHL
jgi:hypothetical protein